MAAQLARTIVTTGPRSTDKATGAVERPLGLPGTPVSTPYASTGLPGAFLGLSLLLALFPTAAPAPPVPWPVSPVPQFTIRLPFHLVGFASYYRQGLAGCIQANGLPYDPGKLTAASLSLPLGARIEACREDRPWRCVQMEIQDAGPAVKGRILDLSWEAMRRLGGLTEGVVPVRIEVL